MRQKVLRLALSSSLTAALLALTLVLAAPVAAMPPERVVFNDIHIEQVDSTSCDFPFLEVFDGRVTITTYFDEEGNPTRLKFHLPFHGTLTNEATGESVSADQVIQATDDLDEGTQSFVGLRFRVAFSGLGVVLLDAGKIGPAGSHDSSGDVRLTHPRIQTARRVRSEVEDPAREREIGPTTGEWPSGKAHSGSGDRRVESFLASLMGGRDRSRSLADGTCRLTRPTPSASWLSPWRPPERLAASSTSAECTMDPVRQFGQRSDRQCRRPVIGQVGRLDRRPRAPPQPDRAHPGGRRRHDVVVDPVADVRDVGRIRRAHQREGPSEERRIGLGNAELLGHRHDLGLDAERPKLRAARRGLVGDDRDAISPVPKTRDDRARVGIEIGFTEAAERRIDGRCQGSPVVDAECGEGIVMLAASGNHRAEERHEGEPGHAEDVRPGRPDPRLVDERLAHIQADPAAGGQGRVTAYG